MQGEGLWGRGGERERARRQTVAKDYEFSGENKNTNAVQRRRESKGREECGGREWGWGEMKRGRA